MPENMDISFYSDLLGDIKTRIRLAQVKATLSANAEMILMYWDIGRMILERQQREGWGTGVLRRLSCDLKSDLPEVKGFSERNLKLMTQFRREYPGLMAIGQRSVAQLEEGIDVFEKVPQTLAKLPVSKFPVNVQQLVAKIPWGHNILLIQTVTP
jgi:hypothetical protein